VTTIVGVLCGAAVGLGAILIFVGFRATPATMPPRRRRLAADRLLLRAAVFAGSSIAMFLLTRWPVGSVLAGGLTLIAPSLVGATARRHALITRTEAVAAWAEMLRDTMAASAGLIEAITASARVAPAPIAAAVHQLAAEIQRNPLGPALRRFADAVDDPAADIVVAALVVAAERQARNLGEVLGAAATSARATATMRLRVEASRARTYTASRLIVGITLTMTAALIVLDRGYLRPFDAAAGQLMLVVIAGAFALGLWSLSRLAAGNGPNRVLTSVGER
jgi:hypothetical protein